MTDRCSIPGCRAEVELDYMGHGICTPHCNEYTADRLRMVLGIEADRPEEIDMAKKKTSPTENPAPVAADTTPVPEAAPTPARRRRKTPTGDTAAQGAAPVETATAEPKPPREALCVFALRLTEPERIKLHDTAGPRGATRFARAVLVAAANQDVEGFKAALAEAGKLRG